MRGMNTMADTTATLENDQIGTTPKGWTATLTGKGSSKWTVEIDETAPSKSRVLKQSGQATFPLLLKDDTRIEDGFLEVRFKAAGGSADRAAGLVWRARDVPRCLWMRFDGAPCSALAAYLNP